ncbi:MAG: hypothetical protein HWE34_11855 [Methylocystaceae bacterium]|nr:hypothetical protein [Methylocystaceae bacterium]
MSRRNDDTVQTAMIFVGLFLKLLAILGSFVLWLFRRFREKKRKELEALDEPTAQDLEKQKLLEEIHFHLDNDLEGNDFVAIEYNYQAEK